MSEELIAAPRPAAAHARPARRDARGPAPYRTHDIHDHPRFRGWWPSRPSGHALVPRRADRRARGRDRRLLPHARRRRADVFDDADQELIELLAAHAAIAITNARLYERSRELSMLAERNRLALELHDVVSQKLFGLVLTAEAAGDAARPRPRRGARAQVERLQALAQEALDELRSLVLELRRPTSSATGSAARCASTSSCCAACTAPRSSSTMDGEVTMGDARPRGAADRAGGAAQRASATPARRASRSASRARRRRASRSPTTAPASTRPTPSCARATSA